MDPEVPIYVCIAGEVRGPYSRAQLRDLAAVQVVTLETLTADAAGAWVPLGTLPWSAEVMPTKRDFGFRAAEFEELNRTDAKPIEVDHLTRVANAPPPEFRGREVIVAPLGRKGTLDHEGPNEVQQIVREVGQRIMANEPPLVLPPPRSPFPRWRWFLTAAVVGTAGFAMLPRIYQHNWNYEPITFSIVAGWIVLYDGFLVYLMVLDRKLNSGVQETMAKTTVGGDS